MVDSPQLYAEKQVFDASISYGHLTGVEEVIPFSYCEIYSPLELKTKVCSEIFCLIF
jgi:hypothetical protein